MDSYQSSFSDNYTVEVLLIHPVSDYFHFYLFYVIWNFSHYWLQDFQNAKQQNKLYDDDIPSAPPLAGSYQQFNQVSQKLPTSRVEANTCSTTAGGSATEVEPNKYKSTILSSAEVETPALSVRYTSMENYTLAQRNKHL